jgi:hypothetical protein
MKHNKNNNKSSRKSPLQKAGAQFIDHLGRAAVERLKGKLGLNTELHQFNDGVGSTGFTTSCLHYMGPPIIPQGTTNSTRVGASIRVTRMRIAIGLAPAATQASSCVCRVIGIVRRLYNGVDLTPAQLQSVPSNVLSAQAPDFPRLGGQILFDKSITVGVSTSDVGSTSFVHEFEPRDYHMLWDEADTTGANANLIQGEVAIFAYQGLNDGTIVAAPTITI